MTHNIADRPHNVLTRPNTMSAWSLVGTFSDRALATSYVDTVGGDWHYKVEPQHREHLGWGIAPIGYTAAAIALVMFVTWFALFTFWVQHSHDPAPPAPEQLTQLPTI